jgi:hypothetical protein
MQVGSPSLGSGSVQDQFKNYITTLQSKAPQTFADMNAAPTPEAVHAALHQNPDWRMGIPGARFENANQLLGTDTSGSQNVPPYLNPNPRTQPTTWQQIMGPLASPPPQQSMLNTGGYQNLPAYLAQPAVAAAPAQPSATDQFATNFGSSLMKMGQQQAATQQAQGNQLVQSLLNRQPAGAAALAQLAANPQAYLQMQNQYLQGQSQPVTSPPLLYYARGGVVPRPIRRYEGGGVVTPPPQQYELATLTKGSDVGTYGTPEDDAALEAWKGSFQRQAYDNLLQKYSSNPDIMARAQQTFNVPEIYMLRQPGYAGGGVVQRPLYAQQGVLVPARPAVINRAPMPMVAARPAAINRAPVPMPSRPPLYLQRGAVIPGRPTGMDTVRALLSPGEMVLNRQQEQAVQPIRGRAQILRPDQRAALVAAQRR